MVLVDKAKIAISVFIIGQIYASDSDKSKNIIGLSNFTHTRQPMVSDTSILISEDDHSIGQNVIANTLENANILELHQNQKISIKNADQLRKKRKTPSNENIHDKFNVDICIKKIIAGVLESVREFVNERINEEEEYEGTDMKLMAVNYDGIIVDDNLIHKHVDDIFSLVANGEPETRAENNNKALIDKLVKDHKKWIMFYLDRKFIECLDYFSGKSNTEKLRGIKRMCDCKEEMVGCDDNYFNHLIGVARNFEDIINKKNQNQKRSESYNSSMDIILESTGNLNRKTENNGSNINLQISGQYNQKNYKNYLIVPKFENPKQGYNFLDIDNKGITVSKNGRLITMVSTGMNTERVRTSDDEEDDNEETNNLPFIAMNSFRYPNIFHENNISTIYQRGGDSLEKINKQTISCSSQKNKTSIGYMSRKKRRKYYSDNCFRKIKRYALKSALEFINEKIKEAYGENYDEGLKLLPVNENCCIKIKNSEILNKTLSKILSQGVGCRIGVEVEHNKEVIERLNKDNKECVLVLLNEKFIEFIEYFSGGSTNEKFNGAKQCVNFYQIYNGDEDYLKLVIAVAKKICDKQKKNETIKSEDNKIQIVSGSIEEPNISEKTNHTMLYYRECFREIVVYTLESVCEYINNKIEEAKCKGKLYKIKEGYSKIGKNIKSIDKTIKRIFYNDLNSWYINKKNNITLIDKLLNDNKETFEPIFNLKLSECINHFSGQCKNQYLNGMHNMEYYMLKMTKNAKDSQESFTQLKNVAMAFFLHSQTKKESRGK